MRKTIIFCSVLSLLLTYSIDASAKKRPAKTPTPSELFDTLDKNHNDFLTWEEFNTKELKEALSLDLKKKFSKELKDLFARMDKDKDTHVRIDEFSNPTPPLKRNEAESIIFPATE